jgi:integrase
MASIHRRPKSQYWHAAWRDENGILYMRSTKQIDRQKALAFAVEVERASKLAGSDSLTEAQARKIIAGIMERAGTDEVLRAPSVKDFLNDWLEGKEAGKAVTTVERYRGVVDNFLAHLEDRANRPLTAITPRNVQSFITKRQAAKLSPSTVIMDAKILRTALNLARRHGLVSTNAAEAVELPGRQSVERGTFNAAEVGMLVNAAKGEWKTLILFGYYTGARLGDCCRMEWAGVDLIGKTLTYTQGKTGKPLTVPLHRKLQAQLEALATSDKPEHYILPGMANKGPGGRHGLSESFKGIVRKAGLDLQTVPGGGTRNISRRTFHALRHSFTSALANAGVSPELRMKLTGHKSAEIHRGYTHHELKTLRAAVNKLPGIKP